MITNKKLTDIAMKTWCESIDYSESEQEATRYTSYILKHYNRLDYEVLKKIKKSKHPKRLYE